MLERHPTFDADGYPTDETLDAITSWDAAHDSRGLVEFVAEAWHWPDYFIIDGFHVEAHTGGWSGNESLISALQDNTVFWLFCWSESRRGGHFVFELPDKDGMRQRAEPCTQTGNDRTQSGNDRTQARWLVYSCSRERRITR